MLPSSPPLLLRFDWEFKQKTRHLEIWSPNLKFMSNPASMPFDACPYYPGPAPFPLTATTSLPSSFLFADGGLGPFDYVRLPQLYIPERPWLGAIIKPYEAAYSPHGMALACVGQGGLNVTIWNPFVCALRGRWYNLTEGMRRVHENKKDCVEPYWAARPSYPTIQTFDDLDRVRDFHEAVRLCGMVQRGMKEMDAFIQFFVQFPEEGLDQWMKGLIAKEEQGSLSQEIPPADVYREDEGTRVYILNEVERHAPEVSVADGPDALPRILARLSIHDHPHSTFVIERNWARDLRIDIFPLPSVKPVQNSLSMQKRGLFSFHRDRSEAAIELLIQETKTNRGDKERLLPFLADSSYYTAVMKDAPGINPSWVCPPPIRKASAAGNWEYWLPDEELPDILVNVGKDTFKSRTKSSLLRVVFDRLRRATSEVTTAKQTVVVLRCLYDSISERLWALEILLDCSSYPSDWIYFSLNPSAGDVGVILTQAKGGNNWNRGNRVMAEAKDSGDEEDLDYGEDDEYEDSADSPVPTANEGMSQEDASSSRPINSVTQPSTTIQRQWKSIRKGCHLPEEGTHGAPLLLLARSLRISRKLIDGRQFSQGNALVLRRATNDGVPVPSAPTLFSFSFTSKQSQKTDVNARGGRAAAEDSRPPSYSNGSSIIHITSKLLTEVYEYPKDCTGNTRDRGYGRRCTSAYGKHVASRRSLLGCQYYVRTDTPRPPFDNALDLDAGLCLLTKSVGTVENGFSTKRICIAQAGIHRELWVECYKAQDATVMTGYLQTMPELTVVRITRDTFGDMFDRCVLKYKQRVRHRQYGEDSLAWLRKYAPQRDIRPLAAAESTPDPLGDYTRYMDIRRVPYASSEYGFMLIHIEHEHDVVRGTRGQKRRGEQIAYNEKMASRAAEAFRQNESGPSTLMGRLSDAAAPPLSQRLEGGAPSLAERLGTDRPPKKRRSKKSLQERLGQE
ncbi:hypothetical protein BDZ89DRAFT_1195017 [Hymenopellis radicata]|nr:hypothetical protein BDZ89DRAFT_1195017 [Hymenopellis radicata]